ncbi:uncharacterized protein Dsimw501_GD29131 [Drosophila simulans]|nr:uncharacterized protein Dsimw501_GD29131 [Drosophila simulans]
MSVCALSQPQPPNTPNQNQKQKNGPARLPALATGNGSASASGITLNGKAKGSVTPPTPPPSPQVRIYEDFDRMSAKEVYYNEAGKKVTVKLLHFPDVPPEEISKLKFDDDDDDDDEEEEDGNGDENENGDDDDGEDKGEEADEDSDSGRRPTSADSEDAGQKSETSGGASNATALPSSSKKIFRRKLSGNNMQPRKCSLAFAQAHGIRQRAEKKLSMPTISITANSGEHVAHNCGLRLNLGRKLSQQHSLPLGSPTSPASPTSPGPRRSHSPLGQSLCPGYIQYSKSLLEVPMPRDYGYASSDDLSSEWGIPRYQYLRPARQRDRDRVPHPKPPPARR